MLDKVCQRILENCSKLVDLTLSLSFVFVHFGSPCRTPAFDDRCTGVVCNTNVKRCQFRTPLLPNVKGWPWRNGFPGSSLGLISPLQERTVVEQPLTPTSTIEWVGCSHRAKMQGTCSGHCTTHTALGPTGLTHADGGEIKQRKSTSMNDLREGRTVR